MSGFTKIDYLRVHPTHLTVYSRIQYDTPRSHAHANSLKNLQKNTHHNIMSEKSTSKCKRSINYLLLNASAKPNYSIINWKDVKFKMAFVTLTLSAPQKHTDNEIKREMLNPFLIESKRLWDIDNYVWRAERQENGNVHFHILVDKFVPWQELRGLWNRFQLKMGYIDDYRRNQQEWHKNGFRQRPELFEKWSYSKQLKAYTHGIKTDWSDPNSTDIHSVKLINNVAAYVTKYMTKDYVCKHVKLPQAISPYKKYRINDEKTVSSGALKFLRNTAQIGRLWGCSFELSHLNGGETVVDSTIENEIGKIKRYFKTKSVETDYYNIYVTPIQTAIELKCVNIVQLLSEFMVRKFILKDSLPDVLPSVLSI